MATWRASRREEPPSGGPGGLLRLLVLPPAGETEQDVLDAARRASERAVLEVERMERVKALQASGRACAASGGRRRHPPRRACGRAARQPVRGVMGLGRVAGGWGARAAVGGGRAQRLGGGKARRADGPPSRCGIGHGGGNRAQGFSSQLGFPCAGQRWYASLAPPGPEWVCEHTSGRWRMRVERGRRRQAGPLGRPPD